MFIKLFLFDLKNGMLKKYKGYLISAGLALFFCLELLNKLRIMKYFSVSLYAGFSEYLLYIFGGVKQYIPTSSNNPFQFPAIWMLVNILLLFITLNYPFQDMQSAGQQILIRTKGRTKWWLSKCLWNISCTVFYYLILCGVVFLFCLLLGLPITFTVNNGFLLDMFDMRSSQNLIGSVFTVGFRYFILVFLVMGSISLAQMALSLFIKPIFSFFICSIFLLLSSYFLSPVFLGNYAMVVRNDQVIANGISFTVGIVYSLTLAALSVIVGLIYFKRYDIIKK